VAQPTGKFAGGLVLKCFGTVDDRKSAAPPEILWNISLP
jgi:hypothetical protein